MNISKVSEVKQSAPSQQCEYVIRKTLKDQPANTFVESLENYCKERMMQRIVLAMQQPSLFELGPISGTYSFSGLLFSLEIDCFYALGIYE